MTEKIAASVFFLFWGAVGFISAAQFVRCWLYLNALVSYYIIYAVASGSGLLIVICIGFPVYIYWFYKHAAIPSSASVSLSIEIFVTDFRNIRFAFERRDYWSLPFLVKNLLQKAFFLTHIFLLVLIIGLVVFLPEGVWFLVFLRKVLRVLSVVIVVCVGLFYLPILWKKPLFQVLLSAKEEDMECKTIIFMIWIWLFLAGLFVSVMLQVVLTYLVMVCCLGFFFLCRFGGYIAQSGYYLEQNLVVYKVKPSALRCLKKIIVN